MPDNPTCPTCGIVIRKLQDGTFVCAKTRSVCKAAISYLDDVAKRFKITDINDFNARLYVLAQTVEWTPKPRKPRKPAPPEAAPSPPEPQ